MSKHQRQQWMIRYRNHKLIKGMSSCPWIEMIEWDKKAVMRSKAELSLYWNDVEVVPYNDPLKRRQATKSYGRDNRDEE